MKNQLQHLYETALSIQSSKEVETYLSNFDKNEMEKILSKLSASTTALIIDTVKASEKETLSQDIADLMFQLFTLMAYEKITLEDINKSMKQG